MMIVVINKLNNNKRTTNKNSKITFRFELMTVWSENSKG
jgi:hypothetical protein